MSPPPAAESSPRVRYPLVDSVRGLAALSVMLYHYGTGDLRPLLARTLGQHVVGAFGYGWIGVHVFFVLSGFVIASTVGDRFVSAWGAARFALRRQVRLDPPYWASIALSCGIALAWRHARGSGEVPSLRTVGLHVLYLQELLRAPRIQPIYWTLAIEVQLYMVFIAVVAASWRLPRRHLVWPLAASAAWSLAQSMAWRFLGGWFVPHWYLFALGAITWYGRGRPAVHVTLATLVAACLWQGHACQRLEPVAGALAASLLALATARDGLTRWLAWRPVVFLGTVSYGVYLLHPIVGAQVRFALSFFVRTRTPAGALVVVTAASLASVGAAWLLHVAVERPAMRLAARVRWSP